MYRLSPTGFVDSEQRERRFLRLSPSSASANWHAKQTSSTDEYLDATGKPADEPIAAAYQLFGHYAVSVASGRQALRILDVGCGVGTDPPAYATALLNAAHSANSMYVGLDPIPHNIEGRSFPFICGRIEDLPGQLRDAFDLFLFSTTLDHFEDLTAVAAAVRRLAAPGAIAIFWIGLHDAHLVAAEIGGAVFARLFRRLSIAHFVLHGLKLAPQLVRVYWYLLKRQQKVDAGAPLDELHFHYFTKSNVGGALQLFGTVRDSLKIPGTNGLFAAVAIEPLPPVTAAR